MSTPWLSLLLIAGFHASVFAIPGAGARMAGYVFTTWDASNYNSSDSYASLLSLSSLGVTHLEVVVTQYVANINDTSITRTSQTPSDASISYVASTAHAMGMRVALKPHVDCLDGSFRGEIGTHFTPEQWAQWWTSYGTFTQHYGSLAAACKLDMFNVGTELTATESREAEWRSVIASLRAIFTGALWYGTNWNPGVDNVPFWDALDHIGVDAYFPISTEPNATVSQLVAGWQPILGTLSAAAVRFNKSIVFSEIGYASFTGAAAQPWACCSGYPNLAAQRDLFAAFFQAVWPQQWLAGVFWWAWDVTDGLTGPCDTGFNIRLKPAEDVVNQAYKGSVSTPVTAAVATAPSAAFPLSVYSNGSTTYSNWSYGGAVNLQDRASPYPGHNFSAAAFFAAKAAGAFVLHTAEPPAVRDFSFLQFDVTLGNTSLGADVVVSLCVCDDCSSAACVGASVVAGDFMFPLSCVIPAVWGPTGTVRIPLAAIMPAANTSIRQIQLTPTNGFADVQFWVDNIQYC